MARITPLAGTSSWIEVSHLGLNAFLTAALLCVAILALGPGLLALLRFINRLAGQTRQIEAWVEEDAPRNGSA